MKNNRIILYIESFDFEKWLFFLFGLTLPFKDSFSTIVILLILLTYLLKIKTQEYQVPVLKLKGLLLVGLLLVFPRIIAFFTGDINKAVDEFIRSIPFILLPLIAIISNIKAPKKIEQKFYKGLLIGLGLFFLICNFVVLKQMIEKKEPLEYFFRWRHLNLNFVKPLDAHPPYIALFLVWVYIKTLFESFINNKWIRLLIVLFLSIFITQLLARNGIIVLILVTALYLYRTLSMKKIVVALGVFSIALVVVANHPHSYLRDKLVEKLNPFSDSKDKRFERSIASIEAFKEYPIFGAGPGKDDALRKVQYKKMNDQVALSKNYNSHNQYLEYLVSSGVVGTLCFIGALLLLFYCVLKTNEFSSKLVLLAFLIACLSESILERSMGIKYFSIVIFLIINSYIHKMSNYRNLENLKDEN